MTQHERYVRLEDSVVLYTKPKAVHLKFADTHRTWVPRRACLNGGCLRVGSVNVSVAQWFGVAHWRKRTTYRFRTAGSSSPAGMMC